MSTGIGLIWNRVVSDRRDPEPEWLEVAPRNSLARLAVAGDTAARGLVGPVFVDYGLALLAVGFLGAFLPHGVLQTGMTRDNVLAPIIVVGTMQTAHAIALEATLSFLGLGMEQTEPSLGSLIANGFDYIHSGHYWITVFPGVALLITIVSINLVGDQLRDVLNPRLQR